MTRVEEIGARKAEILAAVDQEGADVSALETEVRGLNAELEAIKAVASRFGIGPKTRKFIKGLFPYGVVRMWQRKIYKF